LQREKESRKGRNFKKVRGKEGKERVRKGRKKKTEINFWLRHDIEYVLNIGLQPV